jgi:vitamin B12 transport system substrate-binding protein
MDGMRVVSAHSSLGCASLRALLALLPLGLAALLALACEREVSRPASPAPADAPRVAVLAPSLARVLIALGAADTVVGVDQFSAQLPELADRPELGGLFALDLERLLSLRPSLVLGVEGAQQEALFAQLRERGVRVETFRLHALGEVLAAFERVGVLSGRADAGRALAARARAELADVAASTRARERPRVAIVVEREPLFVVGAGSFASDLLEAAGASNVFADLSDAYPRVSLEALAARAPDLLLETVADSAQADAEARAYWSRFGFVQRVASVPRGEVVLPGPELGRAARLLRARVHPDAERSQP